MPHSAEALVEERVLQLQEISHRRKELLREMYHLIQKRDHLGAVISIEEDEDEGGDSLQSFLERFDLEKHPETGHISTLLEDEVALPETPPAYSPVGIPDFEPEVELDTKLEREPGAGLEPEPQPEPDQEPTTDHVISESPMSEPPVSPPMAKRQEEEEEEEKSPPRSRQPSQADVFMDVDEDEEVHARPVESLVVPEDREDSKELMTSPHANQEPRESQAESGTPVRIQAEVRPTDEGVPEKSPTSAQDRSPTLIPTGIELAQRSPTASDILQFPAEVEPPLTVPTTREPSLSRVSPSYTEHLESSVPRPAHDELDVKTEPLDDEVMDVVESETRPAQQSFTLAQETSRWPQPVSAPYQIGKEPSEDQIMALLGPSQGQSSPGPIEQDYHIGYSIPLPSIEPSVAFSFHDGIDDMMGLESTEPQLPFGPEPPYPHPSPSLLPVEFFRKRPSKRKRDKEREKGDNKKEEWQPMGLNKWAAVLKANPVHVKLARASKCLSTRDWSVGIVELRLMRVFERIEMLKEASSWSFRQPKKQRGSSGLIKTHWDYLMDEMKWMRTDFREERRWKLALAYNLVHAVVDWHQAGTLEERVRRGIVVLWKPPHQEDTEMAEEGDLEQADVPFRETQDPDENDVDSRETGTPLDGYASDDESDDEQDKEQQDVLDGLEPSAALQEALEQLEQTQVSDTPHTDSQEVVTLKPKVEEIEDATALGENTSSRDDNIMDVDTKARGGKTQLSSDAAGSKPDASGVPSGLKASSKNPVFGTSTKDGDITHGKSKHKTNQYAAIREQIVYSDLNKLFIDLDDLDLVKSMSELSTDDTSSSPVSALPPPHDLTAIFPDLQPYGMLDVAPPLPAQDGRKKSDRKGDKDDPNKRADDTAYMKLAPMSKFMSIKPTLVGTVNPASHFKHGRWSTIEETPVFADVDVPLARAIDENLCALFEGTASRPNAPPSHPLIPGPPRDARKRNSDHHHEVVWTAAEDALLKQAVDRYPYNWTLIADAFNSFRVTIPTDKRTPWECLERWRERFSAAARADAAPNEDSTPSASTSASASHMTTRGYKRSANQSVAASGTGLGTSGIGSEPRKRRRHAAIHDCIRKTTKKREQVLKSNVAPRPAKSAVHDTHGQFNKMPKLTPAELSRMKAEKEARDAQELFMRRRNDELTRQHLLREQVQRTQGLPPNAQLPQTPAQQTQLLPPSAGANGVSRPVNGVPQAQMVQQIRSQVGISQQQQQQRLAAALANANANARMSPPQLSAAQAAHLRVMAAAQAQGQGQVQVPGATAGQVVSQSQGPAQVQVPQVSNASATLTAAVPALSAAHLSPLFAPRASSSSPGVPHQSPPLPAASPPNANVAVVPRPPSVSQAGQQVQGTPVNSLMQVPGMATQYYLHGLQQRNVTTEQLQALLAQLQQQTPQQYAALAQQQQAQQKPPNGNFTLS